MTPSARTHAWTRKQGLTWANLPVISCQASSWAGIGGGSILSPILIGSGRPAAEVAPAALASTFVTSLGGVLTFTLLSIREGPVAPNWPTGIALGIGGIAGGYLGARMQSRLPDTLIRRIVGILAIAIAAQYLWSGVS